jgi:Uma2 family endonuclease
MSAVLELERRRFSIEEFHKMCEVGIFGEDDRVELIEGEIIEMPPIGGPHIQSVNHITRVFVLALGEHGVVSVQNPIVLPPRSQPQPDISILRPSARTLPAGPPTGEDVLLIIEVADTTLAYDRGIKMRLYAKHRIPEFWILDLQGRRLEVYRDPGPNGYARKLEYTPSDTVSPAALPEVKISLAELF